MSVGEVLIAVEFVGRDQRALFEFVEDVLPPDRGDPIDIISKVGGFDIAGLTGVFLGGAIFRLLNSIQIDNRKFLSKRILETAFRKSAVNRHLATFETIYGNA